MRDAKQRILDMLRAIERIEAHVGLDEARFRADEVLQGYLVYQLMIVGEAAYKMPEDVRQRHTEVPWKSISGLRQVLVHGYFAIDLDVVWGVVAQDLPILKVRLELILSEL